jgi:DNA-binding NarL/FixJ family response regulator
MAERENPPPVRVVIVEDDAMFVDALRARLKRAEGIEVVGSAQDGTAGLDLVAQHRPDVLLLDLGLPGMSGDEVAQRVVTSYPDVAVLVLTGYPDLNRANTLMQQGVRGFLLKTLFGERLDAAVRAVARGQKVMLSAP